MAFSAEAKITWKWVTDEKVDYKNWDTDGKYPDPSKQLYAEIGRGGLWENHEKVQNIEHKRPGAYESDEAPKDKTLNWIQWTKSDGGNDHWYAITSPSSAKDKLLTWEKHKAAANDMGAYLATITTVEEHNFINDLRIIAKSYDTFFGLKGTKENDTEEKEKEPTGPRFVRANYTGRVLGVPPPINSTASTNSPQSGGSYSRISLRNRTRIN